MGNLDPTTGNSLYFEMQIGDANEYFVAQQEAGKEIQDINENLGK